MKKILIISQSFFPAIGGVSSFLISLASGLYNKGYEIHLLHFNTDSDQKNLFKTIYPNIIHHEIETSDLSKEVLGGYSKYKEKLYKMLHGLEKWNINNISEIDGYKNMQDVLKLFKLKLNEIIETIHPDLINVQDYQLIDLLDEKINSKKVLSLHTPIDRTIDIKCLRWLSKKTDKSNIVIVSTPEYKKVLGEYTKTNLISLPPFIDINLQKKLFSKNKYKKFLSKKKNDFYITSIQRFDAKSGQLFLIESFSKLLKQHPKLKLVLVGGPSFTSTISNIRDKYYYDAKEYVKKLGIESSVIFTGSIPYEHLGEIYKLTDIFCMLSKRECFGLALTEAMARKIPVVVTKTGGLNFQIRNGVDGFSVEYGSVNNLVKTLSSMINNKSLNNLLIKNAYKRYEELFSPKILLNKWYNVFNENNSR